MSLGLRGAGVEEREQDQWPDPGRTESNRQLLSARVVRSVLVVALAAASVGVARSSTILSAVTVSNGTIQSNGEFSLGYEFSLNNASQIDALGFFDGANANPASGPAGGPGFTSAHEIAIFSCADATCASGTQVVSGVVPQNAPPNPNGFVYQTLSTPVVLPGGFYVIAGLNHNEQYAYNGVLTMAPGVNMIQNRFVFSTGTVVTFPTQTAPITNGFFSVNFQFEEVPEPASMLLIPGGLGLLALLRKRRASSR
jgi:hypothetical protein